MRRFLLRLITFSIVVVIILSERMYESTLRAFGASYVFIEEV